MSYVALDQDIWTSTMLKEGPVVVSTWILLLASADRHGITRATPSSIASVLRVSDEEIEEAYRTLLSPDPKSRNQDEGGIRMVEQDDGSYLLVSFAKYKKRASKINAARRQAEYEARLREAGDSPKRRKTPKEEAPISAEEAKAAFTEDLQKFAGAPKDNPGRTHYVGDSCPGGHEEEDEVEEIFDKPSPPLIENEAHDWLED